MARFLAASFGPLFSIVSAAERVKSNGWGSNIAWMSLHEGMQKVYTEKKPMMLVIHKMTCPACVHLKRKVSNSSEIQALSKSFVMVNLEYFEAPRDKDFHPDGLYIPRILFFGTDGKVMKDIVNNPQAQYKYNYPNEVNVATSMKKVRAILKERRS
ncbi:thioredoxin domain-containing protein 12 [Aplysia californica]|uniref:Thioredoxin domain-containing protein 12 n=1 Tax=Aplysia californica TaxID=6500 RepID=A0ABM1A9N6_APLCA|nr:thioredoxin domain-containing protein 12 [Aplysia californica]